jgi:antitoxin HicB
MKKNKHLGDAFENFLEAEGIYHDVQASAIKKYFAALIQTKMESDNISKSKMATIMHTSRSAVDRLLDPRNDSITLKTMENAAKAVGKKLKMELV